jgi:Tfp pilus tip-associated adhesin PilY1
VMFTSMVPDASVCGGSGHGWEMMVMGATGGPPEQAMWDVDRNDVINAADSGEVDGERVNYVGSKLAGLPGGSTVIGTSLITSVAGEGTGGGTRKTKLEDSEDCSNPKARCGRISWVELRQRY